MKNYIFLILTLFALLSCKVEKKQMDNSFLKVVCTTSMIADCFSNFASDSTGISSLMGAGVDPHLYDPRPSDLKALDEADIIIYNGLHLEGKFTEKFERLKKDKIVIALGDFIEDKAIKSEQFTTTVDPHFWFNTDLWEEALKGLKDTLVKIQPQYKELINDRFNSYSKKIEATEKFVSQKINLIPENKRVLVTSHDAFNYFGQKFGIEVNALQGISTLSESGIKELADLVTFIMDKEIPTIFVESSVSSKSLESVKENCKARNYIVSFGGTMYSDALGEKGSTAGTYLGMLRANAETISNGLIK